MNYKFLFLAAALVITGCSTLNDNRSLSGGLMSFDPEASGLTQGEKYDNKSLKFVDLLIELDPENYSGWSGKAIPSTSKTKTVCHAKGANELRADEKLSCAIAGFYSAGYAAQADGVFDAGSKGDRIKFRRNRVQDRIILASNQACDDYRRHLLSTQSTVNFVYGNAATLTAGLGAILTPLATSQALAGASAIISGSRAEYNSNFYRKLLAEVVTRGIAESRDLVFTKIQENQKLDIVNYTVEQALADAVQYNSKCTLIAGLESAQAAQSFYADPGLEHLSELLTRKSGNVSALFTGLKLMEAVAPEANSAEQDAKVEKAVWEAAEEAAKQAEVDAVAAEAKAKANPDDKDAQAEGAALRRIATAVAMKASALKPSDTKTGDTEPAPDPEKSSLTEGLNN